MAGRPDLGVLRGFGGSATGYDSRVTSSVAFQYGMVFPSYMPVLPVPPPPPPTQPPPATPPPPPPPPNQQSPSQPQQPAQQTPSEYALQKWQSLQQSRGGQAPPPGNQNWRPSLDFAGNLQRKPRLDGKARFNAYKRTLLPEFNAETSANFANAAAAAAAYSNAMTRSATDSNRSDVNFAGNMNSQISSTGISDKQVSSVSVFSRDNGSTEQSGEEASVSGSDAQRKQNKIGFRTRWNNDEQSSGTSKLTSSTVESNVQANRPGIPQYGNVAGSQNPSLQQTAQGFSVRPTFTKNVANFPQMKRAVGGMIRGPLGKWSSSDNANANAQWQNRNSPAKARTSGEVEVVSATSSTPSVAGAGSSLNMNVNDLPESLRRFVARALDSVARADHDAMLAILHRRLREAIVSKRATEVDWDVEPIPVLPRSNAQAIRSRSRSRSHSRSSSNSSRSRSQSSSTSRSRSRSRSASDDDSRRKRKKRKSDDFGGSRSKRLKKNRKEQKRKEELKKQRKRRSSRNEDADYDDDRERSQSEDDDELASSRGSRTRLRSLTVSPGAAKSDFPRVQASSQLGGGRLSKAAQRRAKAAVARSQIRAGAVEDQAMLDKRAARFAEHLAADAGVRSRLGAATGGKKRQAGRGAAGVRDGRFGLGQSDASQSLLAGLSFSVPFGEDGEESLDALFAQKRIVGTSTALEKPYLRLTAPPEPSSVRPLHILRRSTAMLAARWRSDKSAACAAHVCEQLKSIRQDLTVQCIRNSFTVQIYEMHARICLEVGHREEFNQCQSQLMQLYDDGIVYEERSGVEDYDEDEDDNSDKQASMCDERSKLRGNQLEFLAYRILYCLFTNQLRNLTQLMSTLCRMRLDRLVGIEVNVTATGCGSSAYVSASEQERCLRFALEVRRAYMIGSWSRIFALYADAPRHTCYLLEWLFEQRLRRIALTHVQKAFRPDVPLEWFASQVCFTDKTACLEFLKDNQASVCGDVLVCTKMK